MSKNDEKRAIRCSFCGKHQDQVAKIIAGPGAYICNECVHLCMDILENMTPPEGQMIDPDMPDTIPTPREIKAYLEEKHAELIASGNKGQIMKTIMPELKGKADGKVINQVVAEFCK